MLKKEKKREISKKSILEAAKRLFLDQGYQATSIRKIATATHISPTTIYLYYEDKADIIHALHQEGFKLLNKQFETLHLVEEPYERLKAMGKCYLDFALENPGFYEIMFILKEPLKHLAPPENSCADGIWKEGQQAYQALISTVEDCIHHGYFRNTDARLLALLVWSNLHGLCALKNNGHLSFIADKTMTTQMDSAVVIRDSFAMYAKMLQSFNQ